jgi:hypothetical protein
MMTVGNIKKAKIWSKPSCIKPRKKGKITMQQCIKNNNPVRKKTVNKTIIAVMLASLFSTAAVSAEIEATTQIGGWTITGNHLIPSSDLRPELIGTDPKIVILATPDANAPILADESARNQANADGVMLGNALVKLYRSHGFLSVEVRVDPAKRIVRLVEAPVLPTGPYASYVPAGQGVLTSDALELAAARMTSTAKFNGEQINIEILSVDPQTGNAEIRTSATPIAGVKKMGASVGYSSMGQRYSGPDVATAYGWANIGNGQQLDVSLAHGFSDWRDDSKDGRYESGVVSYRKASEYGLTSMQYAFTGYKTGGEFSQLDLNGTISRATLEHDYLLTKSLFLVGRLSHTKNKQNLGLTGWTDEQSYTALFGGLRYQGASWGVDAGIEQGLGGSQEFNVTPLLGQFDAHYTSLIVNAAGNLDISRGWTITGKAGFQIGADGTPNSAQFALGGPDHGRSYTTGYAATPTGAYASLTLNAPVFYGVQGYAGLDGAQGKPVVGLDRKAKSAFLGARFLVANTISGDVGFSKAIGHNDDTSAKETKFNLVLSASF